MTQKKYRSSTWFMENTAIWNNQFDDEDPVSHFFVGPYSCTILYEN
jgi:hypothetical protein